MFDNQHSLGFYFGRFSTEGSFLGSSPNVVSTKEIGNKTFLHTPSREVHRLASTRFGDEPLFGMATTEWRGSSLFHHRYAEEQIFPYSAKG